MQRRHFALCQSLISGKNNINTNFSSVDYAHRRDRVVKVKVFSLIAMTAQSNQNNYMAQFG